MENKRVIFAIDLKSFYASVECIDRGLDPFKTPLVVCDTSRGNGTIILAVTPYLKKKYGIPSRLRLYDLPKNIPGMIYATPRMERYIQKSVEVVSIYLNYVSKEDLHVYSVDEAFLDITHYLKGSGCTKEEYARKIITEVHSKTGLTVTAGIGENMFMAKAAMDIEAKKSADFMASWTLEQIPQKLWGVTPLSKMWGIGSHLEARLNALGFYQVGDIACADPRMLKRLFGVIGEEIYEHANGIDNARIQEKYVPSSPSLCAGQTLFKDYDGEEAKLIICESLDELLHRLYKKNKLAGGISLYIGYSKAGGFAKGMEFTQPSDDRNLLKESLFKIFDAYYDKESKIRNVCIGAFNLASADLRPLSLFDETENQMEKEHRMEECLESIRQIYGLQSVLRASSILEASNALRRANQIGGHRK